MRMDAASVADRIDAARDSFKGKAIAAARI
jgi:hypothetical protein